MTKRRNGESAKRRDFYRCTIHPFPDSPLWVSWRALSSANKPFFRVINHPHKLRADFLVRIINYIQIPKVPEWLSRRFALSPFRRFVHSDETRLVRFGKREQSASQISLSIISALCEPATNTMRFGSRAASWRYASRTRS